MSDNGSRALVVVMAPVVILVGAILKGFVLSVMWSWFMVPTFSLPEISTVQAIGIALVISYLTHQRVDCEKPKREYSELIAGAVIDAILTPLFVLFIGWFVHLFM